MSICSNVRVQNWNRQDMAIVALSKTSASCQPDVGCTGSIVLDEEWRSAYSHALAAASMPACI